MHLAPTLPGLFHLVFPVLMNKGCTYKDKISYLYTIWSLLYGICPDDYYLFLFIFLK